MEQNLDSPHHQKLIQFLMASFSENELKRFCYFNLGLDYDSLPAMGKVNKIKALIEQLAGEDRLSELLLEAKKERPHLDWDSLPGKL
ncbi:effector-associated domain EAD1-containing protein [Candidatus Leptofilum sp.]|uniref:effector-associated domain EAD1-containing protein n=1 Tax=Candidatus Leptofilum sp. TaxID=3241576 RepID=UPI003B59D434